MNFHNIIYELMLVYTGAAVFSTLFLFLKQPIILSYIFLGMLIGPYGFGLINEADHVEKLSHFGIILLLFLIGLNLHPNKLLGLFKTTFFVTIITCVIFSGVIATIAFLCKFPIFDSLVIGVSLMFSSTVIGLKLIPTSDLHHQHIGKIMLSILLLQDIFAIIIILFLSGQVNEEISWLIPIVIFKLIILSTLSLITAKYLILWLFNKFCEYQEYIFIISLGWCLLVAEIATQIGLSYEIGAFIAGVCIAISPISLVISEKLKPLREFFLILFFFAVGANFDFGLASEVVISGLIIGATVIILKPYVFEKAFLQSGESPLISKELSLRLGQGSEFALFIAYTALHNGQIIKQTSSVIQVVVLLSFIFSTYIVMSNYDSPISADSSERRD